MGMLPGDQRGADWTADRIVHEVSFKEHPFFCEPVYIRRGDKLFVIGTDGIGIMIITHDVNDIRPLLGKNQLGTAAKQ